MAFVTMNAKQLTGQVSMIHSIIAISVGASCGAVLRWLLGMLLNATFPTIPLGTLVAN